MNRRADNVLEGIESQAVCELDEVEKGGVVASNGRFSVGRQAVALLIAAPAAVRAS